MNVQIAREDDERLALRARHAAASRQAMALGREAEFSYIENAALTSSGVVTMPLGIACELFSSDRYMYAPYAALVRAHVRAPAELQDDQRRRIVDTLLYGDGGEKVVFGALSLNGLGLSNYGIVHATLRELAIAYRSTVLEENSYRFVESHKLSTGTARPRGHLATWEDRHLLVASKLINKVESGMSLSDLNALLLRSGPSRADDDFLEVHIYGMFNAQAIESLHVVADSTVLSPVQEAVRAAQVALLREAATSVSCGWAIDE